MFIKLIGVKNIEISATGHLNKELSNDRKR